VTGVLENQKNNDDSRSQVEGKTGEQPRGETQNEQDTRGEEKFFREDTSQREEGPPSPVDDGKEEAERGKTRETLSQEEGLDTGVTSAEEQQIEELKAEMEVLKKEKEETHNLLQRVKADFDNYRKRTRTEKEEAGFDAVSGFICKLLPVMDNLERALDSACQGEVGNNFIEGLEMIKKQVDQVLEQEGVVVSGVEGEKFDPSVHEAVMKTEEGEGDPDTVVEVFQKGYLMKGRVLRPAMVKVKVSETAPPASSEGRTAEHEHDAETGHDEESERE